MADQGNKAWSSSSLAEQHQSHQAHRGRPRHRRRAGLVAPADIAIVELLGTLFVSALKAVAPVLVFFLVISALANAKTAGSMKTVVLLYVVSTFIAALVAVVASYLFPMTSRW